MKTKSSRLHARRTIDPLISTSYPSLSNIIYSLKLAFGSLYVSLPLKCPAQPLRFASRPVADSCGSRLRAVFAPALNFDHDFESSLIEFHLTLHRCVTCRTGNRVGLLYSEPTRNYNIRLVYSVCLNHIIHLENAYFQEESS